MKIGKRVLFGTLGFLSLFLVGIGTVYALKPGNCPSIKDYGPYNQRYDVAFVYGGGLEKSVLRAQETDRLFDQEYFPRVIKLGTPTEIDVLGTTLTKSGVPSDAIIEPVEPSFTTRHNIEIGNRTVKEYELGTKIAHVGGRVQLNRIKRDNESLLQELNPLDDGYFPVDDGFGTPIWRLPNYRDSDIAAWYACLTR